MPVMSKRKAIVCGIACLVAAAAGAEEFRRISVEEYRDKMKGGWVGQIAGVVWGAPTEFKYVDKVIPEDAMPGWTPDMINNAFGQDDLYVEMTFLRSMEEHGLDVSIRQAGIDFANSGYALWCANAAGRNNLRAGIAPPDSSHPNFTKCPDDIDYQIESDFSGLISPGMPQSVISLGDKFGRLMNYGDGVYGGQFMGGMYAEAFFSTDNEAIVRAGLACIPAESQYAGMVRDLLRWHAEAPNDWQACWAKIIEKYRKNPEFQKSSNGAIDVKVNGAILLMGFLYGNRDFDKTIVIATRGGFDSDCNPSSAAGPLFTSVGFKAIPARFTEKLDLSRKFSFTAYDFPALLSVCEKLTRQIAARQGGRVEKDAAGTEWLVIPVRKPQPDALALSWAPGPIAGSRFTPEEYAQITNHVHLASEFAGPDPTQRVQKTLDALFPGWTASANAPDMEPGFRADMYNETDILMTHPPKRGEPAVLSRRMTIPAGDPRLVVRVANDLSGDFRLIVRVDGRLAFETDVQDKKFQTYTVGLSAYSGKTVLLEILNQPTGWMCEAAYWKTIEVK